jgi:hypothetical protein
MPVRLLGVGKVVFGGMPKAANSRGKREQPGQTRTAGANRRRECGNVQFERYVKKDKDTF